MFYFFPSNINVGHVKLSKPLQHWTNIRGLEPDLNIGDPEGSFAGEDLVGSPPSSPGLLAPAPPPNPPAAASGGGE